jgi:hypothetical protein
LSVLIENSETPALALPEAPDPDPELELELELDEDEPVEEPEELPVSEDPKPDVPDPEEPLLVN